MKYSPLAVILISLVAVVFSPVLGSAQATDSARQANILMYPKPQQIEDLVLKNAAGKMVSLKEFRGRVVLLHFWSINCPACRYEEPFLNGLKRKFGPMGLEILGVNLIDPPAAVISHAAAHPVPFPVLVDGGAGFTLQSFTLGSKRTAYLISPGNEALLEVPALPTTYILDCRGSAVGFSVGAAQWNHASAESLIKRLLSDKAACAVSAAPRSGGFSTHW